MRPILPAAVLFLGAAYGDAAWRHGAEDYLPNRRGTVWVYRIHGNQKQTVRALGPRNIDGKRVYVFEQRVGTHVTEGYYQVRKDGIYTKFGIGNWSGYIRYLPWPLRIGQAWEEWIQGEEGTIHVRGEIPRRENVQSCGRIRNCLVVDLKLEITHGPDASSTPRLSFRIWLARGVGMVKGCTDPDADPIFLLEEFRSAG